MELILIPFLLVACFTDMKERKIPNILVAVAALVGVVAWFFFRPPILDHLCGLLIVGLLTGLLFFWKPALGAGDIKLLCLIALYQAFPYCVVSIVSALLSSLLFLILIRSRKREKTEKIPFAPFLLGGYLLAVLIRWLLSVF